MGDVSNTEIQGNVVNPYTTAQPDNATVALALGRNSEQLVSEIHGKFFTACARGVLFTANVAAVTIPVVAATLVSVFSLYNPVGSGKLLELVDIDISTVLATTVVNTVGLYTSSPVLTAKGTFTTAGTALAGLCGSTQQGVGIPYTAYTHSGTPTLYRIVGGWGATTESSVNQMHYDFDGKVCIVPGAIVSVATSTAAETASGSDIGMTWIETPIV